MNAGCGRTWTPSLRTHKLTQGRAGITAKQDDEIFQTLRLINCGWFGFVVFSDYFSVILGLVRQEITASLSEVAETFVALRYV